MTIHTFRRAKWKSIRPAVKTWTRVNWSRFKLEKPAWFTSVLFAQVGDDMILDENLAALGGGGTAEEQPGRPAAGLELAEEGQQRGAGSAH